MNQSRNLVGKEKTPPSRSTLRRQREREQRLQTILAAAGTLFAREGYHRTGMEWIADKAEVSVGPSARFSRPVPARAREKPTGRSIRQI